MKHNFKLSVGDPSNDGHGMYESIVFKCNYDIDAVHMGYNDGVNILGFDFIKEIAAGYQDSILNGEHVKKLVAAGILADDSVYDGEADIDGVYGFCGYYLDIAKLSLPDLKYKYTRDTMPERNLGGYGLFY